jgi:predicted enzyme related to lactoylglutathione lyase
MIKGIMEVILYVKDMQTQVSFYRDVIGLTVKEPLDVEDYSNEFWVEFETGACVLCLHAGGTGEIGKDAPSFVFKVANVEASRNELIAKGVAMSEIRIPAPNVQVSSARDPEGNPFSIESVH